MPETRAIANTVAALMPTTCVAQERAARAQKATPSRPEAPVPRIR